jgi:hypothetical protein
MLEEYARKIKNNLLKSFGVKALKSRMTILAVGRALLLLR